ncbi:MAG: DUF512 domain-containing protein [Clostridia bacterium]|nr:DUF512 domain-containing protein [Clostridia bacterium]
MKQDHEIVIKTVQPGSIAEEAGIEPGDILRLINGEKIGDIFDFRFFAASEELLLEVQKNDGEIWEVEIEKEEYEDLGIEFENPMLDEAKSCTNQCIFCFIDQLPGGMRETLYFKDDDSRLSFLTGNYVTLTNIKEDDLDRIIRYRMSPINVSVHTTNPELRVRMLHNRFAGDVLDKIKRLTDAGITVNCQIVLCRGFNDGAELERSLKELSALYPGMNSISIVPVGITRYRDKLTPMLPFDKESAQQVIEQVSRWQSKLLKEHGSRVVYLADEFYILAGLKLPEFEHYEDFPQLENGVGLIALLRNEFEEYMETLQIDKTAKRTVSIATGVSAFEYIRELADRLEARFPSIKVKVYEIKNFFFGENVTVTGLLTGKDVLSQLVGKELGEELLICKCMLKAGEKIFLDDFSVDMLAENLGIKVSIVENSGKDLIDKILGLEKDTEA